MEQIKFDDFEKLDIRVAEILEAIPHPDADKLLILKINTGIDTRQIVAGIKKDYSTEDLIGKKIAVVCNLKPAKLRGEISEGMLLAASGEDGSISLMTLDRDSAPGSKIK